MKRLLLIPCLLVIAWAGCKDSPQVEMLKGYSSYPSTIIVLSDNSIRSSNEWDNWRENNPEVVPNLRGARLSGLDLPRINLSYADLRKANLRGANLSWANLYGADLRSADFTNAQLLWADLREAKTDGARFINAHLTWAKR